MPSDPATHCDGAAVSPRKELGRAWLGVPHEEVNSSQESGVALSRCGQARPFPGTPFSVGVRQGCIYFPGLL